LDQDIQVTTLIDGLPAYEAIVPPNERTGIVEVHPTEEFAVPIADELRIPTKPAIDSDRNQPPVPIEASQAFRRKPAGVTV
jgi:hypothetical protein